MLEFVPYEGLLSIRFGDSSDQVREYRLGDFAESTNWRKDKSFNYWGNAFSVGFANERVVHLGFSKPRLVEFRGADLFDSFDTLLAEDSEPYTLHGFIYLFKFGVSYTGVDERISEDSKTVSIFPRDDPEVARLRPKMLPYEL